MRTGFQISATKYPKPAADPLIGFQPGNAFRILQPMTHWHIGPAAYMILLAVSSPMALAAQESRIRGRVADANSHRPLTGARVTIIETGATTVTDREGNYTFPRPASLTGATLRAILLGYTPSAKRIRSESSADFELTPRALGLDEVVVTGTAGPTRVREVGHSVAQITPSQLPEAIVSMDNLLQSKVPGVSVLTGSGLAGAGAQIRLRGNTSVALSNQPLVYVDGVRMRSDAYPRNAPQSGNVLRGANEMPSPIDDIDPADVERVEIVRGPAATTLYGTEGATGVIQIFTHRGAPGQPIWNARMDAGADRVQSFGTSDAPFMRIDHWLRTAPRYSTSLSASGGGDIGYYASANAGRAGGILPNDHQSSLGLRGNFDFKPADKLSLKWSSAYSQGETSNTSAGSNLQGLVFNAYRGTTNLPNVATIDSLLAWKIDTNLHHVVGGLTTTYAMSDHTSHAVTIGLDRAEADMRSLRPFGFVFAPAGILSSERWTASTISADYLGRSEFHIGRIGATLAWGGQTIGTDVEDVAGYAETFAGPGDPTLSSGAVTQSFETRDRGRTGGVFSQLVLDFRNRLFLTGGARVDGNSAFGRDFGVKTYPRASASYIISDEPFWPQSLGKIKLRAAYGLAGRAPRSFDAQRTWSATGFNGTPAYLPLSVGNAKLGPETTAELEVGMEGSFMSDRLTSEINVYRRTTRDALFPVTQPASLGFLGSQLENVGSVRGTGFEASVTSALVNRQNFSWTLGLDASRNHSRVTSLGGAPGFVIGENGWILQGEPVPTIRGTFVTNANDLAEPVVETNHTYGPNLPTRTVGLHSSVQIKSVEISGRAEYSGGNFIQDFASRNLAAAGGWAVCDDAYQSIKSGNRAQLTAWQRLWCTPSSVPTDGIVWPADFVRLRTLTLSAPLPGAFLGSRRTTFAISARNIMLWKNHDMLVFDPEMGGRDGMSSQVRTIEMQVPSAMGLVFSLRGEFW